MTTIITDGNWIAADGRMCRRDEIVCDDNEKIIVKDRHIFAIAGVSAMDPVIVSWYLAGADPRDLPPGGKGDDDSCGWDMLVVDLNGVKLITSRVPYALEIKRLPFGLGTGRDYARAAMLAGADARRAVEIAIACDSCSGGAIQVVDVYEALVEIPKALKLVGGQ